MKKNIGTKDRWIRLLISVSVLAVAIWLESIILAALGVFALFEAVSGWCLMYQLLGKTSCTKHKCALLVLSLLCLKGSLSAWYYYDDGYDGDYVTYYDPYHVDNGYYFTLSDGTRWVTFDPVVYDYYLNQYYYNDYFIEPMSSYDAYYYQYPAYGYQYEPYWMTLGSNSFVVYYLP